MSVADSPFHLFGIRHHGPGCARSLLAALDVLQPDCLLIEGPPEGEEMLSFVLSSELCPPVALLIYNPEQAHEASFYPFAEFSPEWQALRYGLTKSIPTHFIDLPASHQLALRHAEIAKAEALANTDNDHLAEPENDERNDHSPIYDDPLDWLGRAAGHSDGESWWNQMIEERSDSLDVFAAIRQAMTTVRNEMSSPSRSADAEQREALREAHMRKCLRQAQKEGFQRIAVVCGAWHVPALEDLSSAKTDNELLKGLPKSKVLATWVPWSYHNLSYASGYGAGITSPAWYDHLWRSQTEERIIGWMARAARTFRDNDVDCSSAHIIEAARLAESLAALRERSQVSLEDMFEALRTVVCMGEEAPMRLIHRTLVVGDRLGQIPEQAPAVPLQRDIAQQQKSLRLKPEAIQKTLDLDLRQPNDLARSHLLHRLNLLNIPWGELQQTGRAAKGTFHEIWTLQWEPKLAIAIIEASRWGNTVETAASHKAIQFAKTTNALPDLSQHINQVLLADLPWAIPSVIQALDNLVALASDVNQLLATIPPLANIVRYGNVRQTDVGMVAHVLDNLIPRSAIGLPSACKSIDDDAAQSLRTLILNAHQAIRLLARDHFDDSWYSMLQQITSQSTSHGLLNGLATRLLFDAQRKSAEHTALHMNQALSTGQDPAAAAAWLEGFLNQSGMVLLHDATLWELVDTWLNSLNEDYFNRVLPLLRRTFAGFSAPERRQLGERAARPENPTPKASSYNLDTQRAERAIPLLRQLLGLTS